MQASTAATAVSRRTRNGSNRHVNTTSGTSAMTHSKTIQRNAG